MRRLKGYFEPGGNRGGGGGGPALAEGDGSLDFFSLEEGALPDLTILVFFGGIEYYYLLSAKSKSLLKEVKFT